MYREIWFWHRYANIIHTSVSTHLIWQLSNHTWRWLSYFPRWMFVFWMAIKISQKVLPWNLLKFNIAQNIHSWSRRCMFNHHFWYLFLKVPVKVTSNQHFPVMFLLFEAHREKNVKRDTPNQLIPGLDHEKKHLNQFCQNIFCSFVQGFRGSCPPNCLRVLVLKNHHLEMLVCKKPVFVILNRDIHCKPCCFVPIGNGWAIYWDQHVTCQIIGDVLRWHQSFNNRLVWGIIREIHFWWDKMWFDWHFSICDPWTRFLLCLLKGFEQMCFMNVSMAKHSRYVYRNL